MGPDGARRGRLAARRRSPSAPRRAARAGLRRERRSGRRARAAGAQPRAVAGALRAHGLGGCVAGRGGALRAHHRGIGGPPARPARAGRVGPPHADGAASRVVRVAFASPASRLRCARLDRAGARATLRGVVHQTVRREHLDGPDLRVARVAEGQSGVVSLDQLRRAGLSVGAIRRRVRSGWLHRLHRGVFAVGHTRLTGVGRMWAAVLAYDRAPLSHQSAAAVWDLMPWPTRSIDISTRRHRASIPGVRVHRPRKLTLDDITRDPQYGLPVTKVARLLVDMTPRLTPHRLERLVHRAEHLRILDVPDPCPRKLRVALDTLALGPPQVTRSELEERFLELVAQAGLPRPLVNHERGE